MATITLFKNVPWSPGGNNVVRFPNAAAQQAYFNSLESLEFPNVDYEPRWGANLNLDKLGFMDARQYNYMSWEDETNGPFYYFIEDYQYLNDNPTTRLIISEDIWQNNHLRMIVNPTTVHRRHMPRWDGNAPILYPVDEGIPRSMDVVQRIVIDDTTRFAGDALVGVIVTNKKLEDTNHPDGIYYYLTYISIADQGIVLAPGDTVWSNPLDEDFISQFDIYRTGIDVIVGAYIMPFAGNLQRVHSSGAYTFPDEIGTQETGGGHYSLFSVKRRRFLGTYFYAQTPGKKPTKSTTPGISPNYQYEPMCYSDNLQKIILTDQNGFQLSSIPVDLAWKMKGYSVTPEFFSLNPQSRITLRLNGDSDWQSAVNGMEAILPGIPLDVPQSQWLDYRRQQQSQQWNILENSIRSNYWQTAVGAVTGAASGGAFGAMYAESFNNSKRSPANAGLAGVAMGGIQGIGSLINSKISATEQRDALKLNEGIIKNTPTPPIGGSNWGSAMTRGVSFITLQADQPTIDSVFSQYHAYGYIVDRVMPVPLRTRYYWDYIELKNASISGPLTSDARSYLEALFNQGITIWHSETFRGFDYNINNPEV